MQTRRQTAPAKFITILLTKAYDLRSPPSKGEGHRFESRRAYHLSPFLRDLRGVARACVDWPNLKDRQAMSGAIPSQSKRQCKLPGEGIESLRDRGLREIDRRLGHDALSEPGDSIVERRANPALRRPTRSASHSSR